MKFHRYRCFGPSWPHRYAYAYGSAYAGTNRTAEDEREDRHRPSVEEPPGSGTWYSHREHRKRGRRSASFGVRRPLRYLSYQLDLDESQRRTIAAVLDGLKLDREQAALDEKKMVSELADQLADADVTTDALEDTLGARVRGARSVQSGIARALMQISGALDPDQREEFVYLLRTGAFRI